MVKRFFIANWKMNLLPTASVALAKKYRRLNQARARIVICPSFVALSAVGRCLANSSVELGAQDCAAVASGAFTGEVAARELRASGCHYVILGHSERRKYQGESRPLTRRKLQAALAAGLTPIVCLGEDRRRSLAQIKAELSRQTRELLAGLKLKNQLILLAYEPQWAISSSQDRPAKVGEAIAGLSAIQSELEKIFGAKTVKRKFVLLYGGTVNPQTISQFIAEPLPQGFLVGGASLSYQQTQKILKVF